MMIIPFPGRMPVVGFRCKKTAVSHSNAFLIILIIKRLLVGYTNFELFLTVCYSALTQIVYRNLHGYFVAGKDSNVMHTHFT